VTKLNPAGTALVFSTFLGGSSIDEGNAIRVSNGAPCMAGYTASLDFPVVNPVQAANAGSYDAVLSCLNASGNALTFSTLLGGTDSDSANALALSGGFGYIAGLTFSRNFPVAGAYQQMNGGQEDGFLAKLFQVPPPLPTIPVLTLPGNGAIGVALNPTLSWSASSTATSYAVYLGTSNPPPFLGTATGNSYIPGTLSPATAYYWQVAATNAVGSVSSGISSFATLACTYVLGPASAAAGANGGAASFSVTSPAGCGWTAASNATWLTVTAGASGNGNGTVNYTVTANTTVNARSGTLTIGVQTFTVIQAGVSCSYALNPGSAAAGPSGGAASFAVTSPTGCGWTATSNATWLTVTAGGLGSGTGTVSYSVAANSGAQSRAGTITAGNSSLAVTQAGIPQSNQPPSIASLSPFAGSGNQTFTLGFSDPNGWANIAHAYLLINVQVWVAASCYVDYSVGANSISLMNDAGTAWLGPIVAGSAASVSNSQCTVSGSGSSASGQGNNLTVNLALSFQASYDGAVPKKNVFLMAADYAGLTADWLAFGIWYPAPLTASLVTRYRLYFPVTLEHLYTTDLNEYNTLGAEGWNQEGADAAVYNGPAAVGGVSTVPMWRLYYTTNMTHMWTTDRNEYLTLMTGYGGVFNGEGADEFLFPVQVASSIPLYRLLFNGSGPPIHHWTTDAYEFSVLTAPGGGWTSEGITGYLFPPSMAGSLQAEKIVNYSLEPWIHAGQAYPQPLNPASTPTIGAILNGASYQMGPASPGQTISLFGSFPVRGGVRVVIGGNEAEMLSVAEREIQAVVPGNITAARIPVTVIAGGRRSNAVELELGVAAPAVFATDPYGRGQAQAFNQDGTPNGASNPAPAGSVVTLTLTGDGNQAISVRIAGRPADVVSVTGQGSGKTGLRVRIPEGLPAGSTVPVRVKAGEFFSQSGVTLEVR
jgi:uncharacterized protein (TIGR03437 family)